MDFGVAVDCTITIPNISPCHESTTYPAKTPSQPATRVLMQAAIVQGELLDCVIRKSNAIQSASAVSEQDWAWFMILMDGRSKAAKTYWRH